MSRKQQKNSERVGSHLVSSLVQQDVKATEIVEESMLESEILKGYIEAADVYGIRGWAMDETNPDEALELGILIDGELMSQTRANIFRADLVNAGAGKGRCAFNIALPNCMFDGVQHKIEVIEISTKAMLKGSPKFFSGQLFQHPSIASSPFANKLKEIEIKPTHYKTIVPEPAVRVKLLPATPITENPVQVDYLKLRQFGFRLFGCVIAPFVTETSKILTSTDHKPVLFLQEAGFHLHGLFDQHFVRTGHFAHRQLLKKLNVSKKFLLKLLLDDKTKLGFALDHPFKGNFKSLLTQHFAFTDSDLAKIDSSAFDLHIECPKDKDLVIDLISQACAAIFPDIVEKRDRYRNYLLTVTENKTDVVCVDVEPSGTVQKLLALLFNLNIQGHYLVLSKEFNDSAPKNCKANAFWADSANFEKSDYSLLDYSKVITSVLTSPDGELLDISQKQGKYQFEYGNRTTMQKHFFYTYPLIQGIDDYIVEMHNNGLSKQQVNSLINIPEAFALQLHYDRSLEMTLLKQHLEY